MFVMMCHCRSDILLQTEHEEEVLVAGDPERQHMAMCEERGGIPYHPNQITFAVRFLFE